MHCPKCGINLNISDENCPQCGFKIEQNVQDNAVQRERLKRPMPKWFKFLIFITFIALVIVSAGLLFTETLVDVAEKQLTALRENDIETAYNDLTSTHFKEATSEEEFIRFVNKYPILNSNHSVIFPERSIVDRMTILKGKLLDGEQPGTPIEYHLVKEDGKWKILSISLLKNQPHHKAEKKQLVRMTKSLLNYLSEGNVDYGYDKYFSEEFKKATSLSEFKNLIQKNPLNMQNFTVSYHHPVIENDVGKVAVVLKSDKKVIFLKNSYIKDHDKWKISSIRILSPSVEV